MLKSSRLAFLSVRVLKFSLRGYSRKSIDLSSIIKPVAIEISKNPDDINIGIELTQNSLKKEELIKTLNLFFRLPEVKVLAEEQGLDQRLFSQAFLSFRKFCIESDALPVELHIVISDILSNAGHVSDIFPYFLKHAKKMFPHIDCMDDLKKISDLTDPLNWYPEARGHTRKIIFHSGPTNSGKTYQALQSFTNAKSGIYCGPLKMLANEVFYKSNKSGTPCDLITGEERKFANIDGTPSNHVSCTVEMSKLAPDNMPEESEESTETQHKHHYEVAVIDEIQMIKDPTRGWAWTRALLGLVADEIHLCGEKAAINMVKDLLSPIGESIEVRSYKRLTPLKVLDKPLGSLSKVKDGDCIVCFSKNDIYMLSQRLEANGRQCAIIYGGLPPGTKLEQARRFNDPKNPCNVMVATDAIGMGINLCIKRIIFYSLLKPTLNERTGEREMERLSVSQALQIAGRAGRYGMHVEEEEIEKDDTTSIKPEKEDEDLIEESVTHSKKLEKAKHPGGEVTTFGLEDLYTLKGMLKNGQASTEPIETAGLNPTAEQIELFSYHLPKANLSNLIDIFTAISTLDNGKYFMCNMEDFKFLADAAQHIPLPLKVRYVFCCAPISRKQPFVCAMFIKFARQFSRGQPLTFDWVCTQLNDWPFAPPLTISDLIHLEGVFDVLDMYLWLSYRFPDTFPDTPIIRDMQSELDAVIQIGVSNLTKLLCNDDAPGSTAAVSNRAAGSGGKYSKTPSLSDRLDGRKMKFPDEGGSVNTLTYDADVSHRRRSAVSTHHSTDGRHKNDEDFVVKRGDAGIIKSYKTLKRSHENRKWLTEQLVERGLVTPKMLEDLQKEWASTNKTSKVSTHITEDEASLSSTYKTKLEEHKQLSEKASLSDPQAKCIKKGDIRYITYSKPHKTRKPTK